MTGRAAAMAALFLCAGCFSSSVTPPMAWTVNPGYAKPSDASRAVEYSVARQGAVTVMPPCDSVSFVVRRKDGSIAHDPYNVFISPPSSLLRAAVQARLESDGRFGRVVPQTSLASADVLVEVVVRDLSLDCTVADCRRAQAAVSVDVLRADRGARTVVLTGQGDSRDGNPAGDVGVVKNGDYTAAFSQAFDVALAGALQSLAVPKRSSPQSLESKPKGEPK